jgi:hypothetical protein
LARLFAFDFGSLPSVYHVGARKILAGPKQEPLSFLHFSFRRQFAQHPTTMLFPHFVGDAGSRELG